MTDAELLARAESLRGAAHDLLDRGGLRDLLAAVGEVALRGSVVYDLMTWPDVDVDLLVPDPGDLPRFLGAGRAVAERFSVATMTFDDHVRNPASRDVGLYWGFRLFHGGRLWRVDVRAHTAAEIAERRVAFDALRRRLAGLDRPTILRIKAGIQDRPEYASTLRSVDVYAAVADGVTTVAGFDDWLARRPDGPAPS
jgi:hypothetical protein